MSASAIQIPPDTLAAHRGLSPAAARLLEHLVETPEDARQLEGLDEVLPKWWFTYDYTPLTWPVLVDEEKQAELRQATEGVCALIKAIPAVIFDGDLQAMADFYSYEDAGYLEMLFELPNALDTTIARCDFMDTADGLKCCEVNLAANIGGWQHRFWEDTYMNHPVLNAFAAREGITLRWRDTLRAICEHVVEDAVETGTADAGELNIVAGAASFTPWAAQYAQELYTQLLVETGSGLTGHLWLSEDPEKEMEFRGAMGYLHGKRVHVAIEYGVGMEKEILRAQVAGTMRVYNGGFTMYLVNKRNLALLSENEALEYWTDEDRALIRAHIPWTRLLSPRVTTFHGETVEFPAFLLERRADVVLKRGAGIGGSDVHVGRFVEPDAWADRLREAMEEGGWVVQEYMESRPYFFPPAAGAAPVAQSVIWGLFLAGWRYAGAWLRMMPAGKGDGIVNSVRGAAEGAVLEIG
ncbi:MAG TPA: hypothetical protein VLK84_14690 [Longimicrobium sp.]|nr:hypothetical protein [Longimicrobium sp.]